MGWNDAAPTGSDMTQRFEVVTGGGDAPGSRPVAVALRPDLLQVPVTEPWPGVLVVAPAGEVDLSTAPLLRSAAFAAVDARPARVVVDLSGLTFCGSTGLVVLMDARHHAEDRGVTFSTAHAAPAVRRVLHITGLSAVLDHRDSLDEALHGSTLHEGAP
jgi:anti-anti-sigma factor